MVIKIVPTTRYNGDCCGFDSIMLDADEFHLERYNNGGPVLSGWDILADGPAHIYGEQEPHRTHEPEMLVITKLGNNKKLVWIRGKCAIYVMNENGKTVDSYENR